VVRFDAAKVKKVRVRGWKETTGQMLVREFERKDGAGPRPTPPGLQTRPEQGGTPCLRELSNLRIKAYLARPGPAAQKLKPRGGRFE